MNLLQLFLGQIPEAIYFALFMIFTKSIQTRKYTFIILMVLEYLLTKYALPFNVWFQVLYTFMTFVTLKVLYKEKSQIIDVFTFTISSIILIIISMIVYAACSVFTDNIIIANCIQKLLLFIPLIIFREKLSKIQNLYKVFWNRNNKPKHMKSTTFRAINVVIFNTIFFVINVCMIYAILWWEVFDYGTMG